MEDEEIKLGFLMGAAQTDQRFAERALGEFERQSRGLDDIAPTEIRQTVIEELRATHETRATQRLRRVRPVIKVHGTRWGDIFPATSVASVRPVVRLLITNSRSFGDRHWLTRGAGGLLLRALFQVRY